MDPEIYTLDEIRPTWFRRIVMMLISPFMLTLLTGMVIFLFVAGVCCAIFKPSEAKLIATTYVKESLRHFFGTIYYWHVDIWNGVTIRNA